jgi:hypothetical protein
MEESPLSRAELARLPDRAILAIAARAALRACPMAGLWDTSPIEQAIEAAGGTCDLLIAPPAPAKQTAKGAESARAAITSVGRASDVVMSRFATSTDPAQRRAELIACCMRALAESAAAFSLPDDARLFADAVRDDFLRLVTRYEGRAGEHSAKIGPIVSKDWSLWPYDVSPW